MNVTLNLLLWILIQSWCPVNGLDCLVIWIMRSNQNVANVPIYVCVNQSSQVVFGHFQLNHYLFRSGGSYWDLAFFMHTSKLSGPTMMIGLLQLINQIQKIQESKRKLLIISLFEDLLIEPSSIYMISWSYVENENREKKKWEK